MDQFCCRGSDQDPTPNARVPLPDFNSKAPYDKGKETPSQGIDRQFSIRIVTQDDDAPQYQPIASVDALLQIIQQADCLKLCGIPGAFNVFKERHFDIWIDSNCKAEQGPIYYSNPSKQTPNSTWKCELESSQRWV
ncbi:hypothetical protein BKA56DRAFT_622160 [Ilyonectria sp. MPI-CAGE-AT-0026]|nr:hypothetical protein BKA56DRAFT_622160 [Ilyonectria sp. MPI-CAGE-AT-0026]